MAGPPGTGKSSCIAGLVETLSECSLIKHKNTGSQMHSHKLQRINPLGVSDPGLMFGKVNASSDFEDGIFTAFFRKANKEHSVHKMTTWICLDAPLHHGWAEFLSSALDKGQVMICLCVLWILRMCSCVILRLKVLAFVVFFVFVWL